MTPISFDAETATLRLDRETFAALVADAAQPTGDAAHLAELREAGAYRDGRFHPALEEGLDAVVNPVCRLEVRMAGAHGREDHCDGWVSGDAAAFLLPAQGQLCEFVVVHPGFVPEQLARVVGLGPRPRVLAAGFQARWQAVMRWLPAPGSAGQRAVQVIDTATGLWEMVPGGTGVAVWPTTPTAVWRRFVTLLPRDGELA